jgi:D-amino-acid oxidase
VADNSLSPALQDTALTVATFACTLYFEILLNRRELLGSLGALTLAGCARRRTARVVPPAPLQSTALQVAPIRADIDRIFRITVCLRPFRAAGPRLDVERLGEKTIIHNYGHGGSGWSLSWGSSSIAAEKALSTGEREFAVIGCGALGLTSATLLQRAGAKVTIYAKERPPDVRSSRATGAFTPDSRIALSSSVAPDFPALWETMARKSLQMYASYLGLPGNPVEWTDRYNLSDTPPDAGPVRDDDGSLPFAHYGSRIADVTPHSEELAPGTHPFPTRFARRNSGLTFNIAAYSKQLVNDFLIEGGKIESIEFHSPLELAQLPQKVAINATGYGARELWNDKSIIPVRGQIAWLIPQPEVNYGVIYRDVVILGRRDGIVVQAHALNEADGYNDANESPDRSEAEVAVRVVAELYDRLLARKTAA